MYPKGYSEIPIHKEKYRDIQYISEEEIAKAILTILDDKKRLTKKEMCDRTKHLFGYRKNSQNIVKKMSDTIEMLIEKNP